MSFVSVGLISMVVRIYVLGVGILRLRIIVMIVVIMSVSSGCMLLIVKMMFVDFILRLVIDKLLIIRLVVV